MPPKIDTRGIIAAGELVVYLPIAATSLYLFIRYGLRRDAGWLFLSIFSLMRITGGALGLALSQLLPGDAKNAKTIPKLLLTANILDPVGVGILLFGTLGFAGLAGYRSYSDNRRLMITFRVIGGIIFTAIALAIAGGILGSQVSPNTSSPGALIRRIGAGIYALIWFFLLLVILGCWSYRHAMRSFRRNLLLGVTIAHPILGLRIAYAVIVTWSSSDLLGAHPSSNPQLAQFQPVTGKWMFYLVFSLVSEFIVAMMYLLFGTILSRRKHR
ncbi:hypothetical protein BDN72DRAFT_754967 [Pluteus cervinus]|uniref:Uncharacterized protein n=1 Tax=Pluteus cervinus TaxID=181527 RepID=A0ACD3BGJ0_9AGAR|nr:hypothetical protein BDN72DRAFT_754967 [Pluteus cervinus]